MASRIVVENCWSLSIADLVRCSVVVDRNPPSSSGCQLLTLQDGFEVSAQYRESWDRKGTLRVVYVIRGETVEDLFQITWIPSPLKNGRRRFYFKCACGRRAGKLFLPPREKYFRCRACHNLTYRSCKHDRAQDQFRQLSNDELARALESPDMMTRLRALRAALERRNAM